MNKIIFYPAKRYLNNKGLQRITIQLRSYNEKGKYEKGKNETIWIMNSDLDAAYKILFNALKQSNYFSKLKIYQNKHIKEYYCKDNRFVLKKSA